MIRNWCIDIRVLTNANECEALDTYRLPEDTGLAVTDDERQELYALKQQMVAAIHRIVKRRHERALAQNEKTA